MYNASDGEQGTEPPFYFNMQRFFTIIGMANLSRMGSPCPVLQQPNCLIRSYLFGCWRTGHGGHRPTLFAKPKIIYIKKYVAQHKKRGKEGALTAESSTFAPLFFATKNEETTQQGRTKEKQGWRNYRITPKNKLRITKNNTG